LPDILPDIGPALISKNPQVKEGSLKFLGRCLTAATLPIQSVQVKQLAETLATLLEDGHEGARNEAATCFGTLMKMVGERPLNAIVEGLADMRKAKVKEAYDKATVKCKAGAATAPSKAIAPSVPLAGKKKVPMTAKPQIVDDDDAPQPKRSATKPPTKHPVRTYRDS
jgi:cytoskeleton-associated protein 5